MPRGGILFLWVAIAVGCKGQGRPGETQSGNPSIETHLCGEWVKLEVAKSPEERQAGLMFRDSLDANHGMVFIFPEETHLSFWMKNVGLALSIGFFNQYGELINSHEMVPEEKNTPESAYKKYPSRKPAKYAVEMPASWFVGKPEGCLLNLGFLSQAP
jgi:uncharacterized membrane protein (UPF0127 family)